MGGYIAVIVVLLVLVYFMCVMLKSVISEANQRVDSYFLKNLEMYDKQYKDKMIAVNRMNVEHEELSRNIRNMRNELVAHKTSPFYAPRPIQRDIFIPIARYIDNDFFEEYKIAKDKLLSIDKQDVIDNVIEKVPFVGDMERYHTAQDILDKLDFEATYNLCSSMGEEQLQILNECFNASERQMLNEHLEMIDEFEEFDILKFIDYVKFVSTNNAPHLHVSVAENEEDYSDADRNIICKVDSNICEGLKIIYQNKIYDYSIYKSRRKVGS